MSIEVAVVIDIAGAPICWHLPDDRTAVSLPDSRMLWDTLWTNRHLLGGVAHSHPGSGPPYASTTDITTFAAIEAGLGRRLDWWIVSSDSIVLYRREDSETNPLVYYEQVRQWGKTPEIRVVSEPRWARKLRELSQYREDEITIADDPVSMFFEPQSQRRQTR